MLRSRTFDPDPALVTDMDPDPTLVTDMDPNPTLVTDMDPDPTENFIVMRSKISEQMSFLFGQR